MSLVWDESMAEQVHRHQQWIAGLMGLVGFLTDHPEIPLPPTASVLFSPQGTPSQMMAAVRDVGRILDVELKWDGEVGQLLAEREFGPIRLGALCWMGDGTPPPAPVDESALPEVDCQPCNGTGVAMGWHGTETCPYCLGKGRIVAWRPRHAMGAPAW
jgi:hypothetical protein